METLKELEKALKELEADRDKIDQEKEALEKAIKKTLEKAKSDAPYTILETGFIYNWEFNDSISEIVKGRYVPVFKTRADAELYKKIHDRAIELIGNWKPDWGNDGQKKHCVIWDHVRNMPIPSKICLLQYQGTLYMPLRVAVSLIEEFGSDLKLWITGEW